MCQQLPSVNLGYEDERRFLVMVDDPEVDRGQTVDLVLAGASPVFHPYASISQKQ